MDKPKLIVFDLNKTLIEENSWLNLNLAMGVTQAEDDVLMAWGQEGIISDADAQGLLCSIYQKRGNPTRANILEVIQNYNYRPQAQMTVKKLGELGFTLALLSGSMDILVEHVLQNYIFLIGPAITASFLMTMIYYSGLKLRIMTTSIKFISLKGFVRSLVLM